MALLLSCWLTIETILIPHGFEKWYCLSFFIHPVLLVLCQIFLWVQFLASGILILIIHPLKRIWYAFLWVFRLLRNRVMSMNFQRGLDEAFGVNGPIQSIVLYHSYRDVQIIDGSKGVLGDNRDLSEEEEDNEEESDVQVYGDSEADESSSLNCSSESASLMCSSESSIAERVVENRREEEDVSASLMCSFELSIAERVVENRSEEEDVSPSLMCSSELSIVERVVENRCEEEDVQIDEFYNKYTERMNWFDLLNYERTCGINADAGAILNKKMGNSSLLDSNIEPVKFSLPYINCSKEARRKLIRSLESDFELVYVGQTCLCWEALHHQYRKVEALADSSTCIRSAFYENVAGKFQQFQVLLERFMENERIGGQRFWNYVQSRLTLKYLLQVPEIPGYVGEETEWMEGRTRPIFARAVMKAIEKSITTFWNFIKTDNKWKLRNLLPTNPQVEDPKDLHLLADLTKALQKKELMMKNLRGRRRCCLKRTNPLEESKRLQVLFCMIDMKLVSMVLKMSPISTHQLKWCQQKLTNIDFKDGGVVRAGTSSLFPPS